MASSSNSSSNSSSKSIVFSYHQNHQALVLKIYSYLKKEDLPVWIDIQDRINNDIYQSENEIVDKVSIVVCLMTPMYEGSHQYQQEIEFVKSVGIPIIGLCILPNWKPSSWLSKITSDSLTINLRGINQRNFEEKINKLRNKIIWLLNNNSNCQTISHQSIDSPVREESMLFDDLSRFSFIENPNSISWKKKPVNYRKLPEKCCLNLSNLMICSNEYILINGNNHLHLFDKNLKLIRSNNNIKINENDLKDLSWCSDSNNFIILTKKKLYLMNPLTTKFSLIENMKLKDQREEYVSCSCSDEKFFLITSLLNTNSFHLEQYNLPTFSFFKKYSIIDLIGTYLFIQNGIFNKNNIQQILSVRYYQKKIAIIMEISFKWFIYLFHLYDQPTFLTKIPLEDRSRMVILNPINQWIIFKDYLSNSFIQISIDFKKKLQNNQQHELEDYSKGFIDFNGKLRSIALFGTSDLVLLIENAFLIYKL